MLKKLKIDDPAKATACISCHGAVVDEKVRHNSFSLNEGVSCVVCHGAHKEWVEKHSSFLSREEFRNLGRDTKESVYG
ncbi:MAG: multiheme c-type cytochrome, partial [Actinomycetes bacterium]